ncbi:hypothetical protein [Flavobacterium sp.]|uniref:hypothetical protein n=1 Tax=Flavobacterium sp. TaxID=239 RepID=UPI0011F83752|nr:hypothetical protein [Flavobacterium sp.]RZJ73349.1 MAG: hypothetical protein EOO49_03295 [Flavobacterium sp.]
MKNTSILLLLLVSTFVGCRKNPDVKITPDPKNKKTDIVEKTDSDALEEHYVDSTKIGIKGHFKLDLRKFRTVDSVYAIVRFYQKSDGKWKLKQQLKFDKDGIVGCDPEFSDFNNDGNGDFTFKNGVAARRANEMRLLIIFDPKKRELTLMKNSGEHPNLKYNRELDCIEGFHVYGGALTCFLKIESDSLREFANVETFDDTLTVTKIDKKGKQRQILRKHFEESYVRFKNYDPVEEYQDGSY